MAPTPRTLRSIVFLISLAALFAYPVSLFAQESIADSEALDAECPAGFDYTCAYPGVDQNGVPCGFGKLVASAEVVGHCVLEDKAMADKVISLEGDWGGTELPDASQEELTVPENPTVTPETDIGTAPAETAPPQEYGTVDTAPSDIPAGTASPEPADLSSAPETETPAPGSAPASPETAPPESSTPVQTGTGAVENAPPGPGETQNQFDLETAQMQPSADEAAPQENLLERLSSTVTSDAYTVYDDVASFFGFSPAGTTAPTVPVNVGIRG